MVAQTQITHLEQVRKELEAALCFIYFPSQLVERHSKPEIEMPSTPSSIFPPVSVSRSTNDTSVLIEPSINSTRISVKIKQADQLENLLCHKFANFMMQRADKFEILRRKAIEGYDLSFLITDKHTSSTSPSKLTDFIITFLEEVDKEISEMKIGVNARARLIAETFLKELS